MPRPKTITQIPLPKAWSTQVKSAVLHVIALAQYALIYIQPSVVLSHLAGLTPNYRALPGQKSLLFDDPSTPRRATLFDDGRDLPGAAEREQQILWDLPQVE